MWDALLGPDPVPPATPAERRELARILAKRRLVWFWFVSAGPVVYLASFLPGIDPFAVGQVWMVGFLISGIWHGFFTPCPRCREQFSRTRFWGNPWTQRCLHCGFPLRPPPLPRRPE
jgi:hypothetical protein